MNTRAFIPGPGETEEDFQQRVNYCLGLKETMPSAEATFAVERFEIDPSWVPLVYSNEKLAPWHGGCAWIFQMEKEGPLGAYLQLRKNLRFYDPKELIAHELCHVGRMAYEEPRFEEFFACRTGKGWRRFFGPIVQSSSESMLFVLSLVLVFFADLFTLFVDSNGQPIASWLKVLPIGLILIGLGRLFWRHSQLNQCIETLTQLVGKRAEALAFRLTDEEIIACRDPKTFLAFAKSQESFRWKTLADEFMLHSVHLARAD